MYNLGLGRSKFLDKLFHGLDQLRALSLARSPLFVGQGLSEFCWAGVVGLFLSYQTECGATGLFPDSLKLLLCPFGRGRGAGSGRFPLRYFRGFP